MCFFYAMFARDGRTFKRGFTLVELLLVIVIIGVLTAIVAPQFRAGIGGTRLQIGARMIAQAARYARTMALLHQAEVELTIDTNGVLRVVAVGVGAEDRGAAWEEDGGALPIRQQPATTGRTTGETGEVAGDGTLLSAVPLTTAARVTSEAFAEAVHVERRLDRLTVRFLGFSDTGSDILAVDAPSLVPGDEAAVARIVFRSNGTCRPHGFRLEDAGGSALEMRIDMLGRARIDEA